MSYSYETQRANLFTEKGQRLFLAVRNKTKSLLKQAGAFRMQEAISTALTDSGLGACDGWDLIACVDRLVELGEIKEVPTSGPGQYKIYTYGRSDA